MANYHKSCWKLTMVLLLLVMSSVLLLAGSSQTAQADVKLLGLPGSLKGKVSLQGRSSENMGASLKVQFYEPGKVEPAYSYNVTSDANGEFIIENIAVGDYVVAVKNAHTLQVAAAINISQGTVTNTDFGVLPEGDANDDNQITILDFSVLSEAFGTNQGNNSYDDRADFNADNAVSILDFSLLAENFNKQGYTVTENSYNELKA